MPVFKCQMLAFKCQMPAVSVSNFIKQLLPLKVPDGLYTSKIGILNAKISGI